MRPPDSAKERLLDRVVEHFAASGIGDTSLRGLADSIGTSHRMLLYHFTSREGLLTAVVARVEAAQRTALAKLLTDDITATELAGRYWHQVAGSALTYGPLFYELAGQTMQRQPHTQALRESLVAAWIDPLATLWMRAGHDRPRAHARLGLAVARGLLFDLLITGDRAGVDAALALFTDRFTDPQP